ncbi:MAG TPA: FIST N-terminal domain-containing protein [Roseiarcus sp.]|nr:FIST N-terminal domain-containing protein [Roseiarcus sp.]
MRVDRFSWTAAEGWRARPDPAADLVLYFGPRPILEEGGFFAGLRARYPNARIAGCSSGGQICGDDVEDDRLAGVAVAFDAARVKLHATRIAGAADSRRCGGEIGEALRGDGLAGVLLLSDGLNVNGSDLAAGLVEAVGAAVPVSGGLAGDGPHFSRTLVGADAAPAEKRVAAIGFYGDRLRIGHGNAGGWSVFGPRRVMTKAQGNVLYELNGEKALDLYERYLGPEDSKDLPGSALLYPLRIGDPRHPDHDVVRTVLSIDRQAGSMTFAGNMPEGWSAQLMRGHPDRLVAGASAAAQQARLADEMSGSALALMVSCIGRRLLMGQSVVGEVEAASEALGDGYQKLGFYSYGEISPHRVTGRSVLHNQTMTVMTLAEAA